MVLVHGGHGSWLHWVRNIENSLRGTPCGWWICPDSAIRMAGRALAGGDRGCHRGHCWQALVGRGTLSPWRGVSGGGFELAAMWLRRTGVSAQPAPWLVCREVHGWARIARGVTGLGATQQSCHDTWASCAP